MDAVVPPLRAGPASHNSRLLLNAERPVVPAVRSHSKSLPANSGRSPSAVGRRIPATRDTISFHRYVAILLNLNKNFARKLIGDPSQQTIKQLFAGVDGVFWVDWREADEDIIRSAAQIIGGELSSAWVGDKLHVKFRGRLTQVPLKFEPGEQYITLATLQEAIHPAYDIRYITASSGGDTIAFMVLKKETLSELEAEFQSDVAESLRKVERDSAYFNQQAQEQAKMRLAQEAKAKERAAEQARIAAGGSQFPTLVHTKDGLKPIEEIRVGDWVLSHPENQPPPMRRQPPWRLEHEYTYRQVRKVLIRDKPATYFNILIAATGPETLKVTPDQLVWVAGHGWAPIARLLGERAVYKIDTKEYTRLAAGKVRNTTEIERFHLLEVDEFQTYYIGTAGVWVHDASDLIKT